MDKQVPIKWWVKIFNKWWMRVPEFIYDRQKKTICKARQWGYPRIKVDIQEEIDG